MTNINAWIMSYLRWFKCGCRTQCYAVCAELNAYFTPYWTTTTRIHSLNTVRRAYIVRVCGWVLAKRTVKRTHQISTRKRCVRCTWCVAAQSETVRRRKLFIDIFPSSQIIWFNIRLYPFRIEASIPHFTRHTYNSVLQQTRIYSDDFLRLLCFLFGS